MPLDNHKPSPVPTSFFVVKNGSKSWDRTAFGIPEPESATVSRTPDRPFQFHSVAGETRKRICPPLLTASIQDQRDFLAAAELLGLAFVAAQSFITLIRTELIAVNNVHLRYLKSPLSFAGSNGYDALKLAPTLSAANCSEVEAINAVANYWKHSEEWPVSEAKSGTQVREVWVSGKNNKRTVEIITALRLVPNSDGNLRKAAKALGVKDFEDLSPIRKILKSWATELLKKARIEFGVKR
jgi:hypothetical protein